MTREVLPENWLDAMVKTISEDRSIGIVGNMQIYPNSNTIQQAGIVFDERDGALAFTTTSFRSIIRQSTSRARFSLSPEAV
ncbi:MAG: hypothetical protein IPP40_14130 [bacterium]|nr:hypothetical protein [bacterium]